MTPLDAFWHASTNTPIPEEESHNQAFPWYPPHMLRLEALSAEQFHRWLKVSRESGDLLWSTFVGCHGQ